MIADQLTDRRTDQLTSPFDQPDNASPHPAELPSTSDTDDLLDAFLHWKGSMFDFARSIGFTIMQVLAWWNLEETQAAVKALETLSDARTKLLSRLSAPAAIETAAKVSEDPNVKPPERRRAAALVLRHAAHRAERRKPPVSSSSSLVRSDGNVHCESHDGPSATTSLRQVESTIAVPEPTSPDSILWDSKVPTARNFRSADLAVQSG